jgi:hypothetical protein
MKSNGHVIYYNKYFKIFKEAIPEVTSSIHKFLAVQHLPFTLMEIFNDYIERRLEFILLNYYQSDEYRHHSLWDFWLNKIKGGFETEIIDKNLGDEFKNFLERLNRKCKKIKIDNNNFCSKALKLFELMFKFHSISCVPLICFYEKELQGLNEKDDIKLDFPISAVYYTVNKMLQQFAILSHVQLIACAKVIYDGRVLLDTDLRFANSSLEKCGKIYEYTRSFDNFGVFAKNFNLRKKTFEKINGVYQSVNKSQAANMLQYEANQLQAICAALLPSWITLQKQFHNDVQRKKYINTILPIESTYSLNKILNDINTDSGKSIEKKSGPRKKKPRRKNSDLDQAGITPPLTQPRVESRISIEPALQLTPRQQTSLSISTSFDGLRASLLQFSKNATSAKEQEALVNASWHFRHCEIIKRVIKRGISPKDYLNLFSAFSFSAAVGLEQIYRYLLENKKINKKNLTQNNLKNHNLLYFHQYAFPDANQAPEAVQKLKLSIIWSRYFYEDYEARKNYTYTPEEMPALLENLIFCALHPSDIKQADFQNEIATITQEIFSCISEIAPMIKISDPKTNTTPYSSAVNFNSISPVINLMRPLVTATSSYFLSSPVHHCKISQSLSSLEMLESSLAFLQNVKSYEEFSFWIARCVFLIQEASELSLRAIESLKRETFDPDHQITNISRKLKLDLGNLGPSLDHVAYKWKYPSCIEASGVGVRLIDQAEVLCLYPELDEGAQIVNSALLPRWKLPLQDVTSQKMADQLNALLTEMTGAFEKKIVPCIRELIHYVPIDHKAC